jgi:hypothetical protein
MGLFGKPRRVELAVGQRIVLRLRSGRTAAAFVRAVAEDEVTVETAARLGEGSELEIGFETDRGPAAAKAVVAAAAPLRLRLVDAPRSRDNRRRDARFTADVQVRATVVRASNVPAGTKISGRLVDISAGGLAFAPAAPLPAGTVLAISLRAPSGAQCGVGAEATVLRTELHAGGVHVASCRFTARADRVVREVEKHRTGASSRRAA